MNQSSEHHAIISILSSGTLSGRIKPREGDGVTLRVYVDAVYLDDREPHFRPPPQREGARAAWRDGVSGKIKQRFADFVFQGVVASEAEERLAVVGRFVPHDARADPVRLGHGTEHAKDFFAPLADLFVPFQELVDRGLRVGFGHAELSH